MKKQVTLLAAGLLCIVTIAGCGASPENEIRISFSGAPEVHQQRFESGGETVSFRGTLSVIGSAGIKVLSADGGELYIEVFQDVRGRGLSMEIAGLTPGGEYTLILDGTDAISCTLTLSTDQKLVGDIHTPLG